MALPGSPPEITVRRMFRTLRKLFRPSRRIPGKVVAKTPRVVILASGHQQRWIVSSKETIPHKQLVLVEGEVLLQRTLRQLSKRWEARPLVVTHHPEIAKAIAKHADVLELPPKKRRWISETALSSQSHWGDPTLILPGDVYWTDDALDVACNFNIGGPIRYLLTEAAQGDDILGLWFRRRHRSRVATALNHAMLHAKLGKSGKLWQSYRSLCGFSLVRHQLEAIHAVRIEDRSTDFDTLGEYLAFVQQRSRRAA